MGHAALYKRGPVRHRSAGHGLPCYFRDPGSNPRDAIAGAGNKAPVEASLSNCQARKVASVIITTISLVSMLREDGMKCTHQSALIV